ncbi:hypothetical protein FN846DRAFT_10960 [Sphaerosporella brunnea]|uniref:Uncharacterized protein n=1 Tax=Sphaerosporella brunnea TaxID=1250544 RepID=A0A5J5EWD7_9PEZI|nr:hypothetical protein FN846DRAFT_10960 [Sphaerosporella brunnea]
MDAVGVRGYSHGLPFFFCSFKFINTWARSPRWGWSWRREGVCWWSVFFFFFFFFCLNLSVLWLWFFRLFFFFFFLCAFDVLCLPLSCPPLFRPKATGIFSLQIMLVLLFPQAGGELGNVEGNGTWEGGCDE